MNRDHFPTSDTQFLAKMLIKTREGDQLSQVESRRLANLAKYGDSNERATTMPEEHGEAARRPGPGGTRDVVRG